VWIVKDGEKEREGTKVKEPKEPKEERDVKE
jgi:hypothetical protein